ncbi:MAG: hypothetical protein IJG87_00605 [Ruminococcus sp.]|nr:hypothetical protein [Ruminococcus sp.]
MKRITAIILIGLMAAASLAACGQQASTQATEAAIATEASGEEAISGGYTAPASPVVTDEVKTLLSKATEGQDGVGYTPVALLGTQVVAGTNYLILCKTAPVTADAQSTYALVTVYEDLNGNAQITEVQQSTAEAPVTAEDGSTLSGGYTEPETPVVTDESKSAMSKATEGLDGASYEAKALLGTQVVAGTNYKLLCTVTPVTENPVSEYAVVTVYEDLNGSAEISETVKFSAAQN